MINGFFAGATAATLYEKAEVLRRNTILQMRDMGMEDEADRLTQNGEAGYPEEPDFQHIAAAAGIAFEIILESAPMMKPLRCGTGEPKVRLKLLKTYDGAKVGHDRYDVETLLSDMADAGAHAAVYDAKRWRRSSAARSSTDITNAEISQQAKNADVRDAEVLPQTKRRRIWRKTKDPLYEAPPAETEMMDMEACATKATAIAKDVMDMEADVGAWIRSLGNPCEQLLQNMLRDDDKKYTRKQLRSWEKNILAKMTWAILH